MRIYRFLSGGLVIFWGFKRVFFFFCFFLSAWEQVMGIGDWIIPLVARVQVNATGEQEKQTHTSTLRYCGRKRERECGFAE